MSKTGAAPVPDEDKEKSGTGYPFAATYSGNATSALFLTSPIANYQTGSPPQCIRDNATSMKERFEKLVREFCATIRLSNPEKMIEGASFAVNGVAFSVAHRPHVDNGLIFIYVDFGDVPKEKEIETYYELLRENFLEFPMSNSSFSISSSTERVVYASAYRLDKFTVEDLVVTLTALTCQAKHWRLDRLRNASQGVRPERRPLPVIPLRIKRYQEELLVPSSSDEGNSDC